MEDQKVITVIKPSDFTEGDIKALTDFFSILLKIDRRVNAKNVWKTKMNSMTKKSQLN